MSLLPRKESGQAILLVLLGVAAILVMALSVVARSVTDISLTTRDDDAKRAFSAAEAGVESILTGGATQGHFQNSEWVGAPAELPTTKAYILPSSFKSGEVGTIWFVSHDLSGNLACGSSVCYSGSTTKKLKFCWGDSDTDIPAIEVSVYFDPNRASLGSAPNFGGVRVAKMFYDSSSAGRLNGFSNTLPGTDTCQTGTTFKFHTPADLLTSYLILSPGITLAQAQACVAAPGCVLFAQVRFLYNTGRQSLAIYSGAGADDVLPSQGMKISSTGTAGEAQRKVEIIQTYKEPLSVFSTALFSGSGGNLEK